ncbi:hypothetical protein GBAR_LOCUS17804, partial [Geodia barretti]
NLLDDTRCRHRAFFLSHTPEGSGRRIRFSCQWEGRRRQHALPLFLVTLGEMVNTFSRSRRKANTAAKTVCCTKTKYRHPPYVSRHVHATAPCSYVCGAVDSFHRWRVGWCCRHSCHVPVGSRED